MLDTFPAILSSQFIQQQKSELASLQRKQAQLAEKFGERHPDMIEVQSAIQIAAQAAGRNGEGRAGRSHRIPGRGAQEQSMTAALEAQKSEALAMNRKAIDYGVIQRDVDSNTQIYDSLLQRAKETGVPASCARVTFASSTAPSPG